MTKYGVLGGITNPVQLKYALNYFKANDIYTVILNGDLSSQVPFLKQQRHLERVFDILGDSSLHILIQPGLEDSLSHFEPALMEAQQLYNNIFCMRTNSKITGIDHDLLFIPGHESDVSNYQFGNEFKSNVWYEKKYSLWFEKDLTTRADISNPHMFYTNLDDISSKIDDPNKTVIISPYPKWFNAETDIDTFIFRRDQDTDERIFLRNLQNKETFRDYFENYDSTGRHEVYGFARGGSKKLEDFFKKYNLRKSVCSNPTVNSNSATDFDGNFCDQGKLYDDIHFNSGRLEFGFAGVISIKENNMSYVNVDLRKTMSMIKPCDFN